MSLWSWERRTEVEGTDVSRVKHARRNVQRVARLAAVGGLLCGGLMVSNAMASEAGSSPSTVAAPADLARSLVSTLGASRTAGSWIADDGRPVVAVTDAEGEAEVRKAGAKAKLVHFSMKQLRSAAQNLRAAPRVAGTAWSVDPSTNKVVVLADSSVDSGEWTQMTGLAKRIGTQVEMKRTTGAFTTTSLGAEPIFGENDRCSAGFNVTDGRSDFILTAGHCGPVGSPWFGDTQGSSPVGATVATDFPGSDFSLVQYQNSSADRTSAVNVGGGRAVRITGAADPAVGQRVSRSGSTTGLRSGEVTGLNATVNYPEGSVSGLIQTSVCAEPGDSGGPLFSQNTALGLTSGGSGNCASGGTTFFQPVTKALSALGVSIPGSKPGSPASASPSTPSGGDRSDDAAAAPAPEDTPQPPGRAASAQGIVDLRTLAPGLAVLGVSFLILIAARWFRQPGTGRRRHSDGYYSTGWS
jgi:streptogrisin D